MTVTTGSWVECSAKNVGRSNETTAEQQAEAEAKAAHVLNMKKGYYETVEAAKKCERFQCMLAKKYEDYKDRIFVCGQAVLTQPKLDGIRCVATREGLKSREGNPIVAVPHVLAAVSQFFIDNPGVEVLDGELYNHELKEDFNAIVSLVRRSKPTGTDLEVARKMIQYHVYDMIWFREKDEIFDSRFYSAKTINGSPEIIHMVETHRVETHSEMDARYAVYLAQGYEGQMIRFGDSKYVHDRTAVLLKRKESQDAEYRLLEVLEGNGNWRGYAKRGLCLLPNGETFTADIVGTQAQLLDFLHRKDEYIGQDATVFFQALTPGGVPRFPKLKVTHQQWSAS